MSLCCIVVYCSVFQCYVTGNWILFYRMIAKFIESLYQLYTELYFTYLEINPLVVTKDTIHILDLAAKLDSTADFVCRPKWGEIDYPPPFGRDAFPEEAYIADLDAKSGASLKVSGYKVSSIFSIYCLAVKSHCSHWWLELLSFLIVHAGFCVGQCFNHMQKL